MQCKPFFYSSWFAQNPILPGAVFIQQNEPHETNFFSPAPLSQLPENPCCYSTGQCCSPLRTARARNRFPALVRSSVEPFFGISNFGQKRQNAPFFLFWAAAAPPLVHQSMLLYYCPVCLPSESCHASKGHIVQASAAHHCELPGLGTVFTHHMRQNFVFLKYGHFFTV